MNRTTHENQKRPVSASAVIRIVIWSVVLCILLGLLGLGLLLGGGGSFGGISLGGYRYDDSQYKVGNGQTDERITELSVDWLAGKITILPSEDDRIHISEDYGGDDSDLRVRWRVSEGELSVKYRKPFLFGNSKAVSKNLTIRIPTAMLEAMSEVDIDAVSCDVSFAGNADELSLDVVEGDLTVQGDIGELDVNAVDGNVNFRGAVRSGDFDCVDATIVMHLAMAAELEFDQVDADVTLYLSEEITGFSATMDSLGGEISVKGFDGADGRSEKSARWGDGGLRIYVDGVDAQLKIEKETKD